MTNFQLILRYFEVHRLHHDVLFEYTEGDLGGVSLAAGAIACGGHPAIPVRGPALSAALPAEAARRERLHHLPLPASFRRHHPVSIVLY